MVLLLEDSCTRQPSAAIYEASDLPQHTSLVCRPTGISLSQILIQTQTWKPWNHLEILTTVLKKGSRWLPPIIICILLSQFVNLAAHKKEGPCHAPWEKHTNVMSPLIFAEKLATLANYTYWPMASTVDSQYVVSVGLVWWLFCHIK